MWTRRRRRKKASNFTIYYFFWLLFLYLFVRCCCFFLLLLCLLSEILFFVRFLCYCCSSRVSSSTPLSLLFVLCTYIYFALFSFCELSLSTTYNERTKKTIIFAPMLKCHANVIFLETITHSEREAKQKCVTRKEQRRRRHGNNNKNSKQTTKKKQRRRNNHHHFSLDLQIYLITIIKTSKPIHFHCAMNVCVPIVLFSFFVFFLSKELHIYGVVPETLYYALRNPMMHTISQMLVNMRDVCAH